MKYIFLVLLVACLYAYADTVTFKGEVVESMLDITPDKVKIISTEYADKAEVIHQADGKTITINYH